MRRCSVQETLDELKFVFCLGSPTDVNELRKPVGSHPEAGSVGHECGGHSDIDRYVRGRVKSEAREMPPFSRTHAECDTVS